MAKDIDSLLAIRQVVIITKKINVKRTYQLININWFASKETWLLRKHIFWAIKHENRSNSAICMCARG